jgi:type VI secretion system secreted protein VgrG
MAEQNPKGAVLARVSTPIGADVLLFKAASISEQLNQVPSIRLEMLSEDADLVYADLLGQPIGIHVTLEDGGERHFHGLVTDMTQMGRHGRYLVYQAELRPWLWFLSRTTDCKVFQDKTVKDIVSEVFADYPMAKLEWRTTESYTPWVYCVQYRETDLDFVKRMLEIEGITWYFEHEEDTHTLILTDSVAAHKPFPAYGEIPYRNQNESLRAERESVLGWQVHHAVVPGKVVLQDYDFTRSGLDLRQQRAEPQHHEHATGEIYDYPGFYDKEADGEQLARHRMEALSAQAVTGAGTSDARGLACGHTFNLKGAPRKSENIEYLVTETSIKIQQADYEAKADGTGSSYLCSFKTLDAKVPFKPYRSTPKPCVQGPQTAVVVGPASEEIYCDEFGRVKVQFHWDRYGSKNDKSSCWVRVSQPWAGKNFGFQAIPRIGQEVIVDFLEGDPDQPIITGRVYNNMNMPPWELPGNKTQSGVLTRSSQGGVYENANAIRFEDMKGKEQLWIHAEKNQDIEVENDETHWVGRDRTKTIDRDETNYIKQDRTETVDRNEKITIHGWRTEEVDLDEQITIHKNRNEKVDLNEDILIGKNRTEKVGLDESIEIGVNRTNKIGKNHQETIGANHKVAIGKSQSIKIGKNLTETIAMLNIQNVGMAKMTNVGLGYMLNVGAAYSINVAGLKHVIVGAAYNEQVAKSRGMTAGEHITLKAGDTLSITGEKKITEKSKEIYIEGTTKLVLAVGASTITMTPGEININAPLVKINCPSASSSAAAAPAPGDKPVETGLGNDVDELAGKSPTLQRDLEQLKKDGWKIDYGANGGGSFADRSAKTITLDGNLRGNPAAATQTLAHEVGHARYNYVPDFSSKDAFVRGTLADEGAATMKNIEVRREILANGGPDIGIAGNPSNHAAYNSAYNQFLNDGNAGAARSSIGNIFGNGERTSTTGQSYADYYGGWYDQNFPKPGP